MQSHYSVMALIVPLKLRHVLDDIIRINSLSEHDVRTNGHSSPIYYLSSIKTEKIETAATRK